MHVAADGAAGVRAFRAHSFDLVITDLMLPDMDGIETLKQIKSHDRMIDVIMVSATDRAREAVNNGGVSARRALFRRVLVSSRAKRR